jgi:hypothetical protein
VIDEMTLAEAGEIFRYWEDNPPPHLLLQAVARLLGWQPAVSSTANSSAQAAPAAALAAVAAMPPPGLAVMPATQIAMPPPTFDLETLRARNDARAAGCDALPAAGAPA